MDTNKEIKRVFELFTEKKFEKAQELNNKILETFPNNMYAKKYEKILADKIKFDNNKWWVEKVAKVRWKSLKCPHCLAKIPFSGLSEEQRNEIKKWNYNNLELKCPYCHTKFVLQKRKSDSIFWIKIWDIANIDWKKYRTTGYVEYSWRWYEGNYSGWVKYLEWLLLAEDNSFLYLSEWKSSDDWVWTQEFEISEKFIPKQIWDINYISWYAEINWSKKYLKETDKVSVKSVYWENSKNTIVWEKVELYDFGDFVIEKESSWSQTEAWFYKIKEISWSKVASYFWKEYNNVSDIWEKIKKLLSWDIFWQLFVVFIIWINFISLIPTKYIYWWIALIIAFVSYYIFKDKLWEKWQKILFWLIWLPIFSFFIFQPIFNSILENKQKIELSKLDKAEKVELNFKDSSVMKEKQTSSTRYDYGGVRTYYSKNTGLKFSVKNDEDKKILEKINKLKKETEEWYSIQDENKLVKMFNWDLYKLK